MNRGRAPRRLRQGSDGPGAAWADGDWTAADERGESVPADRVGDGHLLAKVLQPSNVWYRAHPAAAITVAGVLFAAVGVLRVLVGNGEASTVLFVLPIALLAVAFGQRGGWLGAALGLALFTGFVATGGTEDVDVTGILTRVVAMCLLGGLLGHASDRSRALERRALAEQRRRLTLEESQRREREALEINDSIIQGMVGAKWLAEQGDAEEAAEILGRTIEHGQRLVSDLLMRDGADDARRVVATWEPGASGDPGVADGGPASAGEADPER